MKKKRKQKRRPRMDERDAVRGFQMLGGQRVSEQEKLDVFMDIFHPGRKVPRLEEDGRPEAGGLE